MKLIEDSGKIALVEIDGTTWHMGSEEYRVMKDKPFHFWPYNLKRLNPQPRSCARCWNRPLDFSHTKERRAPPPNLNEWNVPIMRSCPGGSWSKASPFYNNLGCVRGRWE